MGAAGEEGILIPLLPSDYMFGPEGAVTGLYYSDAFFSWFPSHWPLPLAFPPWIKSIEITC